MRICMIARDIQRHDAVGNFCRQIHAFLSAQGYDVRMAAENCHPDDRMSVATLPQVLAELAVDDLILFHFSTSDPEFPAIAAVDNPKILYFHNITPARFFTDVDEQTASLVRGGLDLRPLAARFDVLMANSRVSAKLLHEGLAPADQQRIGKSDIVDCPPIIGLDRWAGIEEESVATPVDSKTTLYVGRLFPHKGVLQLIEGFAVLAARDPRARLLCVGGSGILSYRSALTARIAELEPSIAQRVEFLTDVSDGALKSIYERAGACVSMSFHEGFGVPLVDALVFDKPLVIRAEAGMIETVGDAAMIIDDPTPGAIADALAAALDDEVTRQRLAAARSRRLDRLRRLADGHLILDAVNRARALHRARIV
jgi:glycosyltransferase involved in cell wall biosynthesis